MSLSRFVIPFADVGSGIVPSSGAKLFFYKTNTSTPLNTFSDEGGITPNTNPVISDGNGVFPDIFLSGIYKVVLKDKNDVQKWEADPVTGEQNNSFSYAVSQLANGDATKVALISTGLDVAAIDYLVYPSDGRIYISKGVTGTMANDFNPTTGVDTGLSQAVYIVDFMGFGSMYSYAVSQLAAGDSSKVALIYPGLSITAFDFFVYTIDGRIYAKNGANGTFSNPLVFNPTASTDSGITGALLNVKQNISNVFEYVVSQYANGDKTKVALISPGLSLTAFDYFIYPTDGRVYFKNGATGNFSNPLVFNANAGTDTEVTGTLVNLKKNISDIFTYTVSQLANGDATKVGYILGGVAILAFDFLIYPIDGRIYAKNGTVGTFSDPLDFNPATGIDSGVTGALLNINYLTYKPKRYESTAQIISSSGLVSLTHGLVDQVGNAVIPTGVMASIECTSAEFGYSVGDRLLVSLNATSTGGTRSNSILISDTNIDIYFGNSPNAFLITDKTTKSASLITNGSWRIYINAWYLL
tara:strand:- start:24326 stop:25906 length:1581 start_codon:yes stop_codon:yes gene_type:complete